ncbi:MAG: phage tail protein [Alphaproteobacteria bacterium]|nr:phage tail protein [Alphaproteobacteria bacterium]MBV9694620.1 phage tail protein [Alphaproteobacteria bacterium]
MSTPFLAQIEIFSFNFAPKGWALCNGQLLPINQNQALFSLLGTTFGGDGRVNFALPDLRSRVPIGMGAGFTLGERGGEEAHTVIISEMPAHTHQFAGNTGDGTTATPASNTNLAKAVASANPGGTFTMQLYSNANGNQTMAPGTITNTGGSQPHSNLMPYLCLSMCIALQGIFPSQT